MYPNTTLNTQQSNSFAEASSYHWDHHSKGVSNYPNKITVPGYPIEYSDPVFCHSLNMSQDMMKNKNMAGISNNGLHNKFLNSQTALPFPPGHPGVRPRTVIDSKRAAQNRAAQRAFRQRKERYIKDLERRAKLMDEWEIELDHLRQQNKELLQNNLDLEKQIHKQQQRIRSLENRNQHETTSPAISPIMSESAVEIVPAPVVVYMDTNQAQKKTNKSQKKLLEHSLNVSYLPTGQESVNQPNNKTLVNSPTSSYSSSSSSSLNGFDELSVYQQKYQQNSDLYWSSNNIRSCENGFDSLPSNNNNKALNNVYVNLLPNHPNQSQSPSPFL